MTDRTTWTIAELSGVSTEYVLRLAQENTRDGDDDGEVMLSLCTLAAADSAADLAAGMIHRRERAGHSAEADIQRLVADFKATIEQNVRLMHELAIATQKEPDHDNPSLHC